MEFERETRTERGTAPSVDGGAPLGTLFRRLADDSRELFRQEISLAKLEMKQTANALARDGVRIAIAIGLATLGALALTAFLIIVLGLLLDGAYWAGALIVGALFLLVGGLLAYRAVKDVRRRELKPAETIQTLREDKNWATSEARDFKREVLS